LNYIGIDIAKNAHEVGFINDVGKRIAESFSITNSETGFEKLLNRFEKHRIDCQGSIIGMEATGHYWIALYSHLVDEGFVVNVVNPINTDAFRNVSTIRSAKTDSIDAFLIADLMRFGNFSETHMAEESMLALKQLTRHRRSLVGQRTSLKNRMTALLDQVFPEYDSIFSDTYGAASKKILATCPTPTDIAHKTVKGLAKVIIEASKGRIGYAKAEELKAAASNSFGAKYASEALSFEIKQIVALIDFMDIQIHDLESQISKVLKETNTYLDTIPGIGDTFASIIVAEIGDINRFDEPAQIIAFAGMDVPANQSGEFTGSRKHMSKRGSPSLRWALLEAADKVRIWDSYFGEYYDSLMARGKHHYVAQAAVARKLVNVIFVLLKEERAYLAAPPKRRS